MMMLRMDQQLAMKQSFEHLEKAYLKEMVVEMGVANLARLFVIKEDDDPETFASEAGRRLQALFQPGSDEPPRVGTEDGRILNLHQKQLMNLENALIGFIHTGHTTVERLMANM